MTIFQLSAEAKFLNAFLQQTKRCEGFIHARKKSALPLAFKAASRKRKKFKEDLFKFSKSHLPFATQRNPCGQAGKTSPAPFSSTCA